jgi:Mrp family chromosome partitioning ATPase
MSKIFEALENARGNAWPVNDRGLLAARRPAAVCAALPLPSVVRGVGMEEEMVRLHQQLDAKLASNAHVVIQFIGSRQGEGTSTVAREFARVSAGRFGQRVLLLEIDGRAGASSTVGLDGVPDDVEPARVGVDSFFVAPLPAALIAASGAADAEAPAAWERLRKAYDLTVIDSPPATTSAQGLAVCNLVDGVVLVLAAEETRWPVAERVKDNIERSGGRVLGIALNKRRYHIPAFVYQRL